MSIEVLDGPIAPIDETNNPCELPGAMTPTIANFQRTSTFGVGPPDEIATISETIAAIVTPTVAPISADADERFNAHLTIVILTAQQTPETTASSEAISILFQLNFYPYSYWFDFHTSLQHQHSFQYLTYVTVSLSEESAQLFPCRQTSERQ